MDTIIEQYYFVTFEIYCEALDRVFNDTLTENVFYSNLSEGLFDQLTKTSIARGLLNVFRNLRMGLEKISRDFRLNLADLIEAFKQREVFNMLKAFGFNIKLMYRAIMEFSKAVRGGLFEVFKEMHKLKIFQQLRRGTMKIDEVLTRYPKLARVTGIVVAGLLLFIWLNMTFIGDLDYDFNFSDLVNALNGSFSITDLFMSPEGLMLMTLFGTGAVFGISVPWLGKSLYNLVLAIVYTGYSKLKNKDQRILMNIKRRIKQARFL